MNVEKVFNIAQIQNSLFGQAQGVYGHLGSTYGDMGGKFGEMGQYDPKDTFDLKSYFQVQNIFNPDELAKSVLKGFT